MDLMLKSWKLIGYKYRNMREESKNSSRVDGISHLSEHSKRNCVREKLIDPLGTRGILSPRSTIY